MRITRLILLSFSLLIFLTACVEKYDFNVDNATTGIVIEASISDRSYAETRAYPSDGRYFQVKLARTSDVNNVRDMSISNAVIQLVSASGSTWSYIEKSDQPGTYILQDDYFGARSNEKYRLRIRLSSGEQFESTWEQMPVDQTTVGVFSTKENSVDTYKYYKADGRRLVTEKGVDLYTQLPQNDAGKKLFYRSDFEPLWVYNAARADPLSAERQCWVRTPYYMSNYTVSEELTGGYDKLLTFIIVKNNHRMFEYFSVLTVQTVMSEDYYYFWKDLQAQSKKGGLFDQPPFSLMTNFTSKNSDWTINGYFGVVAEDASRWIFDASQVSYVPYSNLYEFCLNPPPNFPLGPECFDCRAYQFGGSTVNRPWWW